MSWLETLHETYEAVSVDDNINDLLEPYYHKHEQCHIEIILDGDGKFIRAELLVHEVKYGKQSYWKGEDTLIPITPKSLTGRTSGPAPYPLAEQIQYVARDYPNFGGLKASYYEKYYEQLNSWASSGFTHPKVEAVRKYVAKGSVVQDLLNAGLLFSYEDAGNKILINNWAEQGPFEEDSKKKQTKPPLLKAVSNSEQGNAKIRWRVQFANDPDDLTWNDPVLIRKWQAFQKEKNKKNGFCQILGKDSFISESHPKGIIPKANDAKLISIPTDESYLTFRGRFTNSDQPCAISFEVSQKAHNVLRWLIDRQGYSNGEQVIVSWAVSGKPIPEPMEDIWVALSQEIKLISEVKSEEAAATDHSIDAGQSFALQLNNYIRGYAEKLSPSESIVVLGIDAATKGRLGITYYRVLMASDFFERLERWHADFAWPQRHTIDVPQSQKGKKSQKRPIWPVSSPVPKSIAEAAYGDILKSNDTLKKSVLERILPCIVDGRSFPRDIMESAIRRASNRNNCEHWEWERNLGAACALYKGFHLRNPDQNKRRDYAMSLEEERTTRDYLFGRLLAIAERVEEIALSITGESRSTTAARLMQRFADRPSSTWRNIELGLQPYMQRLQSSRPGFLTNRKKELDEVTCAFQSGEFNEDKPLSGEFLLGYHCQRMIYRNTQSETIQYEK